MRSHTSRISLAIVFALVLALALAAIVVPAPAAKADHDTVPWFNYGDFSSNSGFNRGRPTVLADQSGHFYVFYYTSNGISGATNINVTKFATGGIFGIPTMLFDEQVNDFANVNLVDDSYPFSATIAHNGDLYVAWTKVSGGGLGNEVYVSKSLDGGQTWQPAVPVNAAGANHNDIWPFVATTVAGTVYVAWTQTWTPGGFANITMSRSTNGGNTFTNVVNVSKEGRGGLAEIGPMAIDSQGRIYVAYIGITPSPLNYHINLTWSDDGTTWNGPTQITPLTTYALYPDLIVDSRDRVHLAWFDYRGIITVGSLQTWYTRSDTRGATWIPQMPISQGISNPNSYAYLATHGTTVMAVWTGSEGGNRVLSYAISADGGNAWYAEQTYYPGYDLGWAFPAADENGTFYAGVQDNGGATNAAALLVWNGPPSTPTNVAVASGTGSLTVSWTASPEPDVVGYRVYMSTDGTSYNLVADVSAPATSYQVTGLSNGTYWFKVSAVDNFGTPSHESMPVSGTVGPTTADLIAQLNAQITSLQAEITSLQSQLSDVNASLAAELAAAQAQITSLQSQIAALQNSANTNQAANAAALTSLQNQLTSLQGNVTNLQNALNQARAEAATQTMSYVNLGFEILVVVLLGLILMMQMRKPKMPMSMGTVPPKKPEDEL